MSLSCQNLGCKIAGRYLFEQLSFEAEPGDVVRVAGSNGSGKTTLLRVITGLRTPDVGIVSYRNENVYSSESHYRKDLLFIGHAAGLKDSLTAFENLIFLDEQFGADSKSAVRNVLASAGIEELCDMPVRFMSQGQRRRVALARLILPGRRLIWVLDEPFVGLDSFSTDMVRSSIETHRATGGIAVYTTHQDVGLRDTQVVWLDGTGRC